MFDIGRQHEITIAGRDGRQGRIRGPVIGRDGSLIQIDTQEGVVMVDIAGPHVVGVRSIPDGPALRGRAVPGWSGTTSPDAVRPE